MALLAVPLVFSSCSLINGRCLYEIRHVNADGRVLENNLEIVYVQLILGETRDHEPDMNFSWQIRAPELKGHATSITLRDNAAPSIVRYDFPVHPDPKFPLSAGGVRQTEGANINGFFDLLSSKRAIIVISTDLPGRTTITVPISNVISDDWSRPYCS